VTHARAAFALARRQEDGSTLRDHLEARARTRDGESAKRELNLPPLPAGYGYLVDWFNEMHGRRLAGPHGPQPLTWADVQTWAAETGRLPSLWEKRTLMRLDDAYFSATFGPETPAATERPADRAWPDRKAS
jgi:hypothetical protein